MNASCFHNLHVKWWNEWFQTEIILLVESFRNKIPIHTHIIELAISAKFTSTANSSERRLCHMQNECDRHFTPHHTIFGLQSVCCSNGRWIAETNTYNVISIGIRVFVYFEFPKSESHDKTLNLYSFGWTERTKTHSPWFYTYFTLIPAQWWRSRWS